MRISIKYNDLLSALVGGLLFILSVIPHFATIGIILLTLTVFYGYVKKQAFFHFNRITLLFVLLYLLYLTGVFFTNHLKEALNGLEYKLSLLVLPPLLMIRTKETFSYRNVFIGLILGCVAGAFVGLYKGVFCYLETATINCMFSSSVSTIIHPTYFSVYTTLAIIALWIGYYSNYRFFTLPAVWILTCFLVVYTILMMSLTGMLFLGLLMIVSMGLSIYSKWKKNGVAVFVFCIPVLIFLCYKVIPPVKHEIDDVIYYGERYLENSDHYFESLYYPYSGTESRLIMWRISVQQLKETPFGLGTGNVDDALQHKMKENGLHEEFVIKNLNSHNQYLQTGLEVGIFGIVILLLLIGLTTIKAIREKNVLLLALVISFTFNCLFESMLQRQSGVVFYVVLFCVLTSLTTNRTHES